MDKKEIYQELMYYNGLFADSAFEMSVCMDELMSRNNYIDVMRRLKIIIDDFQNFDLDNISQLHDEVGNLK